MKSAKVVSSVASNKPDGLSIALIIILVLIIVACILWYMFYKPKNEVISRSVEGFSDKINQRRFGRLPLSNHVCSTALARPSACLAPVRLTPRGCS